MTETDGIFEFHVVASRKHNLIAMYLIADFTATESNKLWKIKSVAVYIEIHI